MGCSKDSSMEQNRNKIIIMIVIIKELEYTKQVMHDAVVQHLLTDAQPVPKEQPPPPGQPLLSQAVTAW